MRTYILAVPTYLPTLVNNVFRDAHILTAQLSVLYSNLHIMTTSILEEQIGLQQLARDTFTARWHKDWTVGPSELSHP